VETIAGASHFFVGRTDRVVDAARRFVERLVTGEQ
jgi:alpha/beta superfamily hydrolase